MSSMSWDEFGWLSALMLGTSLALILLFAVLIGAMLTELSLTEVDQLWTGERDDPAAELGEGDL